MKLKKLLSLIFCCLLVVSTIGLSGCVHFDLGGPDLETYPETPPNVPDTTIEPAEGEELEFTDLFNGYMIQNRGSQTYQVYDEVTGGNIDFNELLDRQIDVLAQDLIIRLTTIWGAASYVPGSNISPYWGAITPGADIATYSTDLVLDYGDVSPVSYEYKNDFAKVVRTDILTDSSASDYPDSILRDYYDITKIGNYNYAMSLALPAITGFVDQTGRVLHIPGAINGFYMTANGSLADAADPNSLYIHTLSLGSAEALSKDWNYNTNYVDENIDTQTVNAPTTKHFLSRYLNNFKFAIAQILAGTTFNDQVVAGEFTNFETEYNSLLSQINTLGAFDSDFETELTNYIFNQVIGEPLVTKDAEYYEFLTTEQNGVYSIVNSAVYQYMEYNSKAETPKLYKGYNLLVPEVVSMAVGNTFFDVDENSFAETSIYPTFKRVDLGFGNFALTSGNATEQEFVTSGPVRAESITLMPKNGVAPYSYIFEINTALDLGTAPAGTSITNITHFNHDVKVDLKVKFTYVANGVTVFSEVATEFFNESDVVELNGRGETLKVLDYNNADYKAGIAANPSLAYDKNWLEQFYVETDTGGEPLPYLLEYSLEPFMTKDTPLLGEYGGFNVTDFETSTLFNNQFLNNNGNVYLNSGQNYVQIDFEIVRAQQLIDSRADLWQDISKNDIVFDFVLFPVVL